MTEETRVLMEPEEAIATLIGEQFVEWMLATATKTVRSWTEIEQLKTANPKIEKIRKFLLQRFIAEEALFGGREGDPGFLGFAIANLSEVSDPLAENGLEALERLREKASTDPERSERRLWLKLLKATGVTQEEIGRAEAKEPARTYIAELSDVYSNSEWQTAMGALESQIRCLPAEYEAISALLKNNTELRDEELEVFLKANRNGGMELALEKLGVDEEGKRLLWDGCFRQLNIRREFYAGLIKHLLA